MKSYRKKNHIHAFVINRKKLPFICTLLISATLGIFGAKLFLSVHGTDYSSFLKLCCAYSLSGNSDIWNDVQKRIFSLSADTVLSHSIPIFSEDDSSIPVFNFNGEDMKDTSVLASDNEDPEIPPTTNENIIQKSIVSQNLSIINTTSYKVDAPALASADIKYDATGDSPKILIMHTHACETYSDENGVAIGDNGGYRTVDNSKNVTAIGETIYEKLRESGLSVIHDKTLCDSPTYNASYKKALGLIDWYTNKYPSIEFVFDIHRDAITDKDSAPVKLLYEQSPVPCAQAMIVCGTDSMGLYHPGWKDNLTLGLKIQKALEEKYPGFMRPLNLRKERFNMHMTPGSLIFEIGTHANTLEEAKNAALIVVEGILDVLRT